MLSYTITTYKMITKFNTYVPSKGSSKGGVSTTTILVVLGLGVAAYFGYKYYKKQQEEQDGIN